MASTGYVGQISHNSLLGHHLNECRIWGGGGVAAFLRGRRRLVSAPNVFSWQFVVSDLL